MDSVSDVGIGQEASEDTNREKDPDAQKHENRVDSELQRVGIPAETKAIKTVVLQNSDAVCDAFLENETQMLCVK